MRAFLGAAAIMGVVSSAGGTRFTQAQSGSDLAAARNHVSTSTVGSAPTFNRDIVSILQRHCQSCHRPGQIGPMSLLRYEDARPWAKAIKTKVQSREMPPWFADSRYGRFSNDRSLTRSEIDTIVSWVDAGAPAGRPQDAPPATVWPADNWLIAPDVIVRSPALAVPGKPPGNVVEWTNVIVPGPFMKDTWVTSLEMKPGHVSVTHHICVYFQPHRPDVTYDRPVWLDKGRDLEGFEVPTEGPRAVWPAKRHRGALLADTTQVDRGRVAPGRSSQRNAQVPQIGPADACYLPGGQPFDYRPYHAGKLIPGGSDILFSIHYTPDGTDRIDVPMLGITVTDVAPAKRWISAGDNGTAQLEIPPNEPNYGPPPVELELAADAELVMMMPHMHVRGKDMTYSVEFADGRKEVVLRVPKYNFHWQLQYLLAEPLRLRIGSKVRAQAHYNNSASNRDNPNPNRTVYQGNMAWEEMFSPLMGLLVDESTNPLRVFK
jgi:hypothetical protein